MMYTNADQLSTTKKHELIELVSREKPHIIAICEVNPKNGSERLIQDYIIEGFTIYSANLDNHKGRGIIILVHSSISHLVLQIKPASDFEEICLLEIKLKHKDILIFGCIYRSPTENCNSDNNNNNLNNLLKQLSLTRKYSHLCILGDFNFKKINWLNWSTPCHENSKEEKFLEALRDSFLHQHVLEPTRSRGTDKPSTLDLILTNEEAHVPELNYNAPLGKSDHSILSFNFNCYFTYNSPNKRYRYDQTDFTSIKEELDVTNWLANFVKIADSLSVQECWEKFKQKILDLRDRYVPSKEEREPFWKTKGKIPINQELRQLIKDKKHHHRKWVKSLNKENETTNRETYAKIRNKVKSKIKQAKKNYEQTICEQSTENPKRFWKHVRGNLKTKTGISPLLLSPNDNNTIRFEDRDKANILQDQFCSVYTKEPIGELPYFASRTNKIFEMDLTVEMVRKEISLLNNNKALGPDELHPRMLKELVDYVATPIFIIMTKSLVDGCVPEDWRLAHVTAIYKKGPKNIAENYRPISLTSIVCRMMEKIIKNQIMKHLLDENLLSKKQHGFIKKRSTVTQLLNFLDTCTDSLAAGDVVDVIYFDFAKAFDKVPHQRLLQKLQCYGIKHGPLKWISSFLTDRHQIVKVNGTESVKRKVHSGVPQGSVLGPLLFVIYINDLPDNVSSDIYLFADDTKLLKNIVSIHDALVVQNDINALEEWSKIWLLQFHPGKCHVLTLGKFNNIKHAHAYTLGGTVLEHVFREKDLGVIIDSELSFEEHISNQIKKSNSILGLIRRSFSHLSPKSFRQLYISFVRPHLEYAHSVWSPHSLKQIRLIEGVQRRATRMVESCRNLSYPERLDQINMPTLDFRRKVGDMVEVYKHLHYYDQSVIPKRFKFRTRPNRKHKFELQRNFGKDGTKGIQTNSFYFRSVKPWNDLSRDVVESPSVLVFKRRLAEAWKTRYKYLL